MMRDPVGLEVKVLPVNDPTQPTQQLFITTLVAEFRSPKKVYPFSPEGDYSIPRSAKCTHSATKLPYSNIMGLTNVSRAWTAGIW